MYDSSPQTKLRIQWSLLQQNTSFTPSCLGRHCSQVPRSYDVKVQLDLCEKEFCVGSTFVTLSRVKDLGGLMILDSLDYS
ncbi:hypothetical protein K435DRAFT_936489, partial [Dendrothele bispora CBS 962.96]